MLTITTTNKAKCLLVAAEIILDCLKQKKTLGNFALKNIMTIAFGESDRNGAWLWKDAWDATEIGFYRTYCVQLTSKVPS